MSDAAALAELLTTMASVRDGLGEDAFLRAVARAKVAVARAALEEAEAKAGLRHGNGTVVPFVRPSGPRRMEEDA